MHVKIFLFIEQSKNILCLKASCRRAFLQQEKIHDICFQIGLNTFHQYKCRHIMYMYILIFIFMCTYTFIYIYVCVYVCVQVYVTHNLL